MTPGSLFFEGLLGGADPALVSEAADRAAVLLVRGARDSGDSEVADRLLHLADTEGIETIAEVWAGAPADSLAGCLWRLYLLRSWVYADPVGVSREFVSRLLTLWQHAGIVELGRRRVVVLDAPALHRLVVTGHTGKSRLSR